MWCTTTLSITTWVNSGVPQGEQLDDKRRDDDVAPDPLMFQELRDKPAEAEGRRPGGGLVRVFHRRFFKGELECRAGIMIGKFLVGKALRRVGPGLEQGHAFFA